uniref:Uncharacterized protein PF11_0207-like n=1 Tax=Diabrotica virgifera virgifera TaxID=50390 RepID=A0A6P7GEL9_DIAVI
MNNSQPQTPRGSKRERIDDNTSPGEQHVFQKSKIIARSPQRERTHNQTEINMEEIKEMLREFNKSLKEDMAEIKREIKNDIKEIREDIKDMKKEIQKSKEEMGSMVEEITQVKAEWDKEKEAVYSRIKEAEDRMEKIERQKIRNNLLITGITMDAQNDSILVLWKK